MFGLIFKAENNNTWCLRISLTTVLCGSVINAISTNTTHPILLCSLLYGYCDLAWYSRGETSTFMWTGDLLQNIAPPARSGRFGLWFFHRHCISPGENQPTKRALVLPLTVLVGMVDSNKLLGHVDFTINQGKYTRISYHASFNRKQGIKPCTCASLSNALIRLIGIVFIISL